MRQKREKERKRDEFGINSSKTCIYSDREGKNGRLKEKVRKRGKGLSGHYLLLYQLSGLILSQGDMFVKEKTCLAFYQIVFINNIN
jgi:hypothetical protein